MTDNELIFHDPETGKPLHRVPKAAPIPAHTSYGTIPRDGRRSWVDGGVAFAFDQRHDVTYFTRELIEAPTPPLPTEPGSTIRAIGPNSEECAVMTLTKHGHWHGVEQGGNLRSWCDSDIREWEPVAIVSTEMWDRLRVFDSEDKRDRVDAEGYVWRYNKDCKGWESGNEVRFYTLEAIDRHFGPLRFADKVDDDE